MVTFAGGGQVSAATMPTTQAVTVYGQGHVAAQADKAMISLNLSAHEKTSKEVNKKMRDTQRMIIKALKSYGVGEKDLVVNYFSVYPYSDYQYGVDGKGESQAKITAYDANRTLTLTVRNVDMAEEIQDVLLEMDTPATLNVNSVSYALENTETAMDQAREVATVDATKRATKMAKLLNVQLGDIVNSVEVNNYMYYPATSYDGSKVVDIYMQVEVSYEIKR